MTSRTRLIGVILLAVAIAGFAAVAAAELIPIPEFSDHAIPTSNLPVPADTVWPILDVVILLLALAATTYVTYVTRNRRQLVTLTVASVAWFGFWRQGCVCPVGATQNVALALADSSYIIPITVVAFFLLPLVFALFFGRTFCAAVCPLGAVQELVAVRPQQTPRWLDHALGLVPYIYLGAAVVFAATGSGFLICRYDPFVAIFRLNANAPLILFGAALLALGVFVGRPYCRFLCPYGALLRVVSRVSRWRVRITPSQCLQCRLCEHVCPYGAIRTPTLTETPPRRREGKRQLAVILLVAPLLIGLAGWWGSLMAVPLSNWHPQVGLAEQLRREESGAAVVATDASEAFVTSGRSRVELYREALAVRQKFRTLGLWMGAWVGLVFSAKLVQLCVRRRRTDFEPHPAACVGCGRCYWYCPVEQVRLGWIPDASAVLRTATPLREPTA